MMTKSAHAALITLCYPTPYSFRSAGKQARRPVNTRGDSVSTPPRDSDPRDSVSTPLRRTHPQWCTRATTVSDPWICANVQGPETKHLVGSPNDCKRACTPAHRQSVSLAASRFCAGRATRHANRLMALIFVYPVFSYLPVFCGLSVPSLPSALVIRNQLGMSGPPP